MRPDLNFDEGDNAVSVTYCPERILPGTALEELVNNDRIIGAETKASADKAEDLYRVFVKGKIVTTTWEVAEISKLAENSFRDVNIAFANELSRVCDEANVNFWEVQKCTNLHPRVNILNAGPGVGGHCIPVDPWFLIEKFPNVSSLMRTAREVNDDKAKYVADKVLEAVAIILSNGTKNKEADISINIFGYAYKENVGDTRESPSKIILKHISSQFSGKINVFDPHVDFAPDDNFNDIQYSQNLIVEPSDISVCLVNHSEFEALRPIIILSTSIIDPIGMFLTN